jgi:hypothetical protein
VAEPPLSVVAIGWRAHAALASTEHAARPLGALSESAYLTVGDELIWLGRAGASLHARAVLVDRIPERLEGLAFDQSSARLWRPPPAARGTRPSGLASGYRALCRALPALGEPAGFGALLVGRALAFPLDGAGDAARALARACGDDDPAAAVAAAERLIGLGPGLTPAGDDYVGGAFFARRALGPDGAAAAGWARAATQVRSLAAARTHPVSAVLLSDLLAGEGHEPLHELANALAAGAASTAVAAVARLVRIGHSSGWDLLAGFLGCLSGN